MLNITRLSLSQIKLLEEGTKLVINPLNNVMKDTITQRRFTLVQKDGNVYTLMNTDFYDFIRTGCIKKKDSIPLDAIHELKYILYGYNGFELLLEEETNEIEDEEINIDDLKNELRFFVEKYTTSSTQFLIQLHSIERICYRIEKEIKDSIKCNKHKNLVFKAYSRAIGEIVITYNVESKLFNIFKEAEYESKEEIIVPYDSILNHIFDTDISFRIVGNCYDELVEKAIDIEDARMENEDYCDSSNDFLQDYLLEDYHSSKDTLKFLTCYGNECEIKNIMTTSLIYAI